MCKKLALIAALLGLAMLLVLPLAGTPAKGPTPPAPPVPGRIAVNDRGWIYMLNPDGSGRTLVAATDDAGKKFGPYFAEPAWSPVFSNGTAKIAYFAGYYAGQTPCLMVVDAYPPVLTAAPVEGLIAPNGIFEPAWSPSWGVLTDGTERVRVAFGTWLYWDTAEERLGVYVVDLNYQPTSGTFTAGSYDAEGVFTPGMNPLVVDPGAGGAYYRAPRFSPDGQWLAVSRLPSDAQPSIWLVSTSDPTTAMPLINQPGGNRSPAWWQARDDSGQPTGPWRLAFVSNRSGRYEIHIANGVAGEDGIPTVGSTWQLTKSINIYDANLTWSPDGTQIAYHAQGKPNVGKIGRVIVATGQQYDVTTGQYPAWSPWGVPGL